MQTLSLDLRERILASYDQQQGTRPEHGEPCPGGEHPFEPLGERHDHRPPTLALPGVDAEAPAPRGFTSR